jgi:aspartate aminotransferase-like enzyme
MDGESGGSSTPSGGNGGSVTPSPTPGSTGGTGTPAPTATKKQFYGTISLDPVKAKMDFATIMDEVVQQFTAKLGVNVKISVEIKASSRDGFDESMQRTVKENCNVLRFNSAEFEEES